MNPYCQFQTPREACYGLMSGELVARPWDIGHPDTTAWWLVPSTEWPAYRYGKYHFDWGSHHGSTLLCGLYVEKGLGPEVRSLYPSAKGGRSIMGPNWTWFQFLRDLHDHRIERMIDIVARQLSSPIEFRIDGSYVTDPGSYEADTIRPRPDVYLLRWQKDAREFELVEARRGANLLDELAAVKNFDELSSALSTFGNNPWLWVDVFIALRLRIARSNAVLREADELWNVGAIWERFFRHLLPWIV